MTNSLRSSRFYYGWAMVPITIIGGLALAPGQSYGIGEFKQSLLTDLQLSESLLSTLYGVATFLAGFTAILAGAAMDRFGLRRAITVSFILLAASCLFASRASGPVTVFFAFLLLRVFGHGVLPLMTGTTLAMWFHRRLGVVTGLSGVAVTALAGGIPALYLWLIQTWGWREAWVILGVAICVIMLPIMGLFFRDRPAATGQRMDGEAGPDPEAAAPDDLPADLDLASARRVRAFWCLLALHATHGMIFAAVMFHRVQICTDHGLTAWHAAVMFTLYSFTCGAAQLVGGWVVDRVPMRYVLATTSLLSAVGLLLLAGTGSVVGAFCFGVLYGLGTGAEVVGRQTAWPRWFGTRHLGKIKSWSAVAAVTGSGIGPFVAGVSFDRFDGFVPALFLFAGIYGLVGVAMLSARSPACDASAPA